MRLGRNCTRIVDYTEQTQKMGHRFIDKGYDKAFIEEKIAEVAQMDRTAIVQKNRSLDPYLDQVPIILDYSIQHKKIERIIQCHWHILKTETSTIHTTQ